MASFTALNIEPDDQSDDEVDNTRELQIEEALKLYQVSLKFHSRGPRFYPQAAEAYGNLFRSEIFRYPDTVTEFTRIDEHPELEFTESSFALELAIGADGAPSTLPKILYLSYKNHGIFILDCVNLRYRSPGILADGEVENQAVLRFQGKAALDDFTRALARDESDTELWRRAARVGALLGSRRIARYCLEAAVEVDDDPTVSEVDPASLEEGFAGEQLREQLEDISDEISLSHPIMRPYKNKRIPPYLVKYMNCYPYLPDVTRTLLPTGLESDPVTVTQTRSVIDVPEKSWTALGDALCRATLDLDGAPGAGIILRFPAGGDESIEHKTASASIQSGDQIMQDVSVLESPAVAESIEPATSTPITAQFDDQAVKLISTTTTTTIPLSDGPQPDQSMVLPTRKRSQSAAGIRDAPEDDNGAQKRSKRIRNRDNMSEGAPDPAMQYAEQLKVFVRADEDVFAFVGDILTKLGIDDLGTFRDLQTALSQEGPTDLKENVTNTAVWDLRDILRTWDDSKASTFVNGNVADILGSSTGGANAGLAAFLEHSKAGPQKLGNTPPFAVSEGISSFAQLVEDTWMPLQDVVFEWLIAVLVTYRRTMWPEDLKVCVVRIISFVDPNIFSRLQTKLDPMYVRFAGADALTSQEDVVQTLFELHLDIYSRITNPNSIVHHETRVMTKERLDRWADFAADSIRSHPSKPHDELSLRYLWASVFFATMAENVSREHKVLCWSDLQALLQEAGNEPIELQNNAVMPEISAAAAEREVSRLTTMDFFFNLFQTDRSDPVAIIETLEPVLDPESACQPSGLEAEEGASTTAAVDNSPAALRDMWKFLKGGSTSLRLFLWQRLREAYFSIGYNTKVFSCHLKSIEIILADLRTDDYVDSSEDPRRHKLLMWLKVLDDLLVKALTIALNDSTTCFEIIDERHIKSTCAALAQLNRVLHSAAIFDDEVRVGMTQLPQNAAYAPHGSFNGFINRLREMQIRSWSLLYTLVKEAMAQMIDLFPTPDNDLADFLALVHYSFGLRKCCKASNKIFLKMMRVEMIRFKQVDKWEDYLGQVLYDLYGIRLGVGTFLLEEHGCPPEPLDRRTVLSIAEQVIVLANRMSMKDLLKHELRPTIERMQQAVGQAKSTPQMLHNLRNYTEYLKTSIRPLRMYQAFNGQVQVDSLPVVTPDSPLADKGWYFLLGMMALTKFRSQKRLGPGAQTDDMRVGATFMRLQLQYTADHWETWYRLAQCFDYELEEEVLWSADKINNHRPDLVKLQRSSVHCYVMALSTAIRTAKSTFETAEKLSEMYHEFGMRLYASSREPFGMEAFWVDEFEKHMSGSSGMYKKSLHEEMSRYQVWKYASALFKRSLVDRPNYWMNHFMLGKCLWKMYCKAADDWDSKERANRPSVESVLSSFLKAVKTAPKQKDNRQEPILEPHYKLVSVVHKLVMLGAMPPQDGADLLQDQPYAIRKGDAVVINDHEDWEPFILESLRHLRNADKQHWHHRMIARVANILYDENKPDYVQASAARHEFRESIFTKTMHIQVWKPEAERPGRHCVYMERYVLFMIKLLWMLNDKANMELLVKRVRKKSNEFFRFSRVWNECCTMYLRLIRRAGQIAPNIDEVFKSVSHEEFEILSDRLNLWIADPRMSHPALDALRETIELKKLNANQMKSTPMDDMINDAWAVLYTQVAKTLPGPGPDPSAQQPQMDGEATARAMGPMSLNNLVMNMDGTTIPVPVTFAAAEPPRPRKLGIGRREVLRKAELAVNRVPEPPRAIAPARPQALDAAVGENGALAPRSSSNARVEISALQREDKDSSAPGSLHDSADDESDLSELSDVPDMDDAQPAMIFPNLVRNGGGGIGSSGGEGGSTPANDAGA